MHQFSTKRGGGKSVASPLSPVRPKESHHYQYDFLSLTCAFDGCSAAVALLLSVLHVQDHSVTDVAFACATHIVLLIMLAFQRPRRWYKQSGRTRVVVALRLAPKLVKAACMMLVPSFDAATLPALHSFTPVVMVSAAMARALLALCCSGYVGVGCESAVSV